MISEKWIVHDRPMPENPPLHPRHGTHEPTLGSPARRPGSIRRTATTDLIRPQGVNGDLLIEGRARDLLTTAEGEAVVIAEASLAACVDFMSEREVRQVTTSPALPGLDALVGLRASSGFRRAVDEIAPGERDRASALYLLLDDVPVATLVSGYAVMYAGLRPMPDGRNHLQHPDLCAGWRKGGTILVDIERTGFSPVVTGPAALPLGRPGDPLAWHDLPQLLPNGMRRHRRLDVTLANPLEIDVLFRDSHMSFAGGETVIHEYTVQAAVDQGSGRIVRIAAIPRVLPFVECPVAAASAARLIGTSVAEVRAEVRREFAGPSTCTHLNDMLRSLADVGGLFEVLQTSSAAG